MPTLAAPAQLLRSENTGQKMEVGSGCEGNGDDYSGYENKGRVDGHLDRI